MKLDLTQKIADYVTCPDCQDKNPARNSCSTCYGSGEVLQNR